MAATYRYTIILEREPEGGCHVSCPTLKGCHSQGDSVEEAIANMRKAIEAYLESVEAHGDPIPRENLLITPLEIAV
jgi:predicted RNase H-like HicB family nuclease